jgi:hypothetical protein
MSWEAVGIFAAVVGLFFTGFSVWLARDEIRDAYEQRYVERYWQIADDQLRVKYGETDSNLAEMHRERYLRLCEDEFEAANLGNVSRRTWRVWHAAIEQALEPKTLDRVTLEGADSAEYVMLRACIRASAHAAGSCPGRQQG